MDVTMAGQLRFENLPFEILEMIMTYLHPSDRREMSLVQKDLAAAADSVSDIALNFDNCRLDDLCEPLSSFLVPFRTYKRLIIGRHCKFNSSIGRFCESFGPTLSELVFVEPNAVLVNTLLRHTAALSKLTIHCESGYCVSYLEIGISTKLTHLDVHLNAGSKERFVQIVQQLPELRNLALTLKPQPDQQTVNYLMDFIKGSQVTNLVFHGLGDQIPFMINAPQLNWSHIDFDLYKIPEENLNEFFTREGGSVTAITRANLGVLLMPTNLEFIARKCPNLQELDIFVVDVEPDHLDYLSYFNRLRKVIIRSVLTQKRVAHKLHDLQMNRQMEHFELIGCLSICHICIRKITESYPNLRVLSLNGVAVNDGDLQFVFRNLRFLRDLALCGCRMITSAGLVGLSNLKGLQRLRVDSVVTDENLCYDFCLPELRVVCLTGSHEITDVGVEVMVENCPALEVVNLDQCSGITYDAVEIICDNLKKLKTLSFKS